LPANAQFRHYLDFKPAPAPAQTQVAGRVVPTPTPVPPPGPAQPGLVNGKYYALVIGIDHYPASIPTLTTAVRDATAVAKALADGYGFQVTTLIDDRAARLNLRATRANILNMLNWYRNNLTANDNLLIYYAGHGYYDDAAKVAYWLPLDADSALSPNRISADDLNAGMRAEPARHVLVISDSCYSGDLSMGGSRLVPATSEGQARTKYLARMLASRSRHIMASGGDEPVSDGGPDGHSIFAYAFLQALQHPDDDMFTAEDLFQKHLKQWVGGSSDQQPRYDPIRNSNHEEGDFVFMRGGVASATP
jgi:uncharacterized caspase-like protein